MGHLRKFFLHDDVILATARTQQGLPFVCKSWMDLLINSTLAKGSEMYDVSIIAVQFMANHFHVLLHVKNPDDISKFMKYVKQETSHGVNRLTGWRQRSLWTPRFDSPALLTGKDVFRYLSYLYLNPVAAGLVPTVDEYPGISTWSMMKDERTTAEHIRLTRDQLPLLPEDPLLLDDSEVTQLLKAPPEGADKAPTATLTINPWGWLASFADTKDLSPAEAKARLLKDVAEGEANIQEAFRTTGRSFLGAEALKQGDIRAYYIPQKHAQKMICISHDKDLRIARIQAYKRACDECKEIFTEYWSKGDLTRLWPPGFFKPSVPIYSHPLPRHWRTTKRMT